MSATTCSILGWPCCLETRRITSKALAARHNYADLSFLFTLRTGETQNAHLGAEYLAVLETNHRGPYFLNLHYQDIAHSLILGASGSGKSFFLNFLLTNLQKYQPLTYIFDLGGSYENVTRLFAALIFR